MLLDSSYNEIRTLRVDANGNIYAAAVSGRSGGGGARSSPSAPEPSHAGADAQRLHRDHGRRHRRIAGVADTARRRRRRRDPGPAAGALFRILPDGASDLVWESREDTPYDLAFEPGGSAARRHRQQGQDLSAVRRSAAADARRARQRAAGDDAPARARRPHARRDVEPREVLRLSAARADRGTYTSDVRDAQTVATWGTIKWQDGSDRRPRRDLDALRQHAHARRNLERLDAPYADRDGSPITSPRARYLQWRAVLIAARGESPLLTSVTAAYLPRNLRPRVTSITIHPPGTVFQRPFPTDPEIAGFDGDLPDRRARRRRRRARHRRRVSAAAPIRRGC